MRVEVTIRRNTIPPPTPAPAPRPAGVFAYVLHDFQTSEYFRQGPGWNYCVPRGLLDDRDKLDNAKGWPQMVPFEPREGVKLTEDLQWFWVRQLILSRYGDTSWEMLNATQKAYIKDAWAGLTKGHTAFTNGRGTDTCRDYIRNIHDDADPPILWENSCGGSLVQLTTSVPYGKGYKVKTLKTSEYRDWRDWTFLDHPQFFTFGTNATPYLVGTRDTFTTIGPWKVDPMHYLGGRHVPVPIISDAGFVFVKTHRVRILREDEPTPYPYKQ